MAGDTRGRGRVGSNRVAFSDRYGYEPGICTLTLAGHTLRLSEAGTALRIGSRVWELTGPKKTILVRRDGTSKLLP